MTRYLNEYELTLIIRPDLEDSATNALVEKIEGVITDNDGTVLLRDDWGKRKLAYAIRKHLKGHYVLEHFVSPASSIAELERRLRIEEPVIRFLTVRVGEDVNLEERREAAEILRKQKEEEARLKAEAEARAAAEAEAAGEHDRMSGRSDDDDDDDDNDNDDE